jgi:hypothetical protein
MNRKIRDQRAYVKQCEAAMMHYAAEAKAGRHAHYGNLDRLLSTSLDVLCVQQGKLNEMNSELK